MRVVSLTRHGHTRRCLWPCSPPASHAPAPGAEDHEGCVLPHTHQSLHGIKVVASEGHFSAGLGLDRKVDRDLRAEYKGGRVKAPPCDGKLATDTATLPNAHLP